MRRIVAAAFVSLDGVMQAPGGPEEDPTGGFDLGGWVAPYWDEDGGASVDALHEKPFDLLLGRNTYDIFAAYWPYMAEDPIGQKYNRAEKFVVTASDMALDWAGSQAVRDIDGVARLKQGNGADLLMWGSSTLYPQLLQRGLIDRLVLMTFPVVLGNGKRLFGSGTLPRAMKLVESKTSGTGVLIAHYEPAGDVETGSFETQEPSEAEIARREKMKVQG
jgi:dihydrofolate reductase